MYGGPRSHRTFFDQKSSVATGWQKQLAHFREMKNRVRDFRFRASAEPHKTARQIRIDQIRAEKHTNTINDLV